MFPALALALRDKVCSDWGNAEIVPVFAT